MQAQVSWQGRMTFTGTAGSGFTVPLGTDPSVGGDNDGFLPLELMLVGLAGCTAMDVISILQKMRQDVTAYEVHARVLERAPDHPRVFTRIQITYVFTGRGLDAPSVERAIQLSEERYCSAQAMLRSTAQIDSSYTIHEAG
ncbi:MAG: OsmC family protein [Chloroflexaceae bacterium]|nr:OsmC family protein [Chloroflexaceae bacterium]